MLDAYGGLAAQIVTPVMADGRLEAIVSVHRAGRAPDTGRPTRLLASAAAERVRGLREGEPRRRLAQPLAP